jgi:hypothetical protein
MPKKKTKRMHRLEAIDRALRMARKLSRSARYGGLAELDATLVCALEALEWLRQYPDTLLEPLAALERNQFDAWLGMNTAKREVTDNHRAWAKAVIEIFKTGEVDLRRK